MEKRNERKISIFRASKRLLERQSNERFVEFDENSLERGLAAMEIMWRKLWRPRNPSEESVSSSSKLGAWNVNPFYTCVIDVSWIDVSEIKVSTTQFSVPNVYKEVYKERVECGCTVYASKAGICSVIIPSI